CASRACTRDHHCQICASSIQLEPVTAANSHSHECTGVATRTAIAAARALVTPPPEQPCEEHSAADHGDGAAGLVLRVCSHVRSPEGLKERSSCAQREPGGGVTGTSWN